MSRQHDQVRCDCGRWVPVTATSSAYEFNWRCECKRAGVVSWFHGAPPPLNHVSGSGNDRGSAMTDPARPALPAWLETLPSVELWPNDRYVRLADLRAAWQQQEEGEFIETAAIFDAIERATRGEPVSDFMTTFPIVRAVADLRAAWQAHGIERDSDDRTADELTSARAHPHCPECRLVLEDCRCQP